MKFFEAARITCLGVVPFLAVHALGQVTAAPPYTVSVFAMGSSGFTRPDSIAVLNDHVFVGYGNNVATDGTDGKSSTIVEYDLNGDVITTFSVKGHNDGLRLNPQTKQLWAIQNEDGNPNLVILDPEDKTQKIFSFTPTPTPHGGGYDDVAFRGDNVFISASNPANNPNDKAAIVQATLGASTVSVSPVVLGNATAIDIPTGMPVALNLQDPDSMAFDPMGDLVLDSQADAELIIVHHPGKQNQKVFHLGLTRGGQPVQIDDTVYATAPQGFILVSDRDAAGGAGIVYKISKPRFSPGAAYSATPDSVALLDSDTGVLTDVVTGLVSPHGMTFIAAEDRGEEP